MHRATRAAWLSSRDTQSSSSVEELVVEDRVLAFFSVCLPDRVFVLAFQVEQILSILSGVIQRQVDVFIISRGKKVYTKYHFSWSADPTNPQQRRIRSSRVHRCSPLHLNLWLNTIFTTRVIHIYEHHILLWLGRGTNHGPRWPGGLLPGHEYS